MSFLRISVMVVLLALSAAGAFLTFEQQLHTFTWENEWKQFKVNFKKAYSSPLEEAKRFKIFKKNMVLIAGHNHKKSLGFHGFNLAVNAFADLESSEIVAERNGFRSKSMNSNYTRGLGATFLAPHHVSVPNEVDWRSEGYVTPVKNQGACGSCWSFSTTGSLEGQMFRKTGRLVSLSEQNLVDCSSKWGNNGCNGGLMDQAFQYIKDNGGLDTEESYPYEARDDSCRYDPLESAAEDKGFVDVSPPGDEEKLQVALATVGPIAIAIDASHQSFHFYNGGVYEDPDCSPENLDHGVLLVGYGSMEGKDYWIVKNSWGEEWGDKGFIYIRRNKGNMCGVATQASYPIV